ncbi:alpha/beta hydrolase [Falsiroseomonas sp.]|uniref:alpha/beta hydrolase n=1 Tax=Falsiroseomonas sp. TaxID=2870721 RepID=UPI00271F0CCB|nr:alpha/beta hydrolase [Falsiroseomonas sp.]MDO9498911.1 alpha/beta hydrolase [Falsiroseomonas sp.]
MSPPLSPLALAFAQPGRSAIPWADAACDLARPLTLHGYRPASHRPENPVVIVQHGMLRNGDDYRDFWIPAAEKHGLLIIAPTYGKQAWPEAEHYNNGQVLDDLGQPRPAESWGYAIPQRIFQALRQAGVTTRDKAHLFGHSAGGQFGHRLLSTQPHDWLEAATIGNPGWYTLPALDRAFPEGLGGIGLGEAALLALLAFPMTILAGDQDTETDGPSLPSQPAALAQGLHRFARAHHYLEAGRAEAARRGVACKWKLVPVPGVGHDGRGMSAICAALWFEDRLISAAEAGVSAERVA